MEKQELIKFFTYLNDLDELGYTEKSIKFYVKQYMKLNAKSIENWLDATYKKRRTYPFISPNPHLNK